MFKYDQNTIVEFLKIILANGTFYCYNFTHEYICEQQLKTCTDYRSWHVYVFDNTVNKG